MKVDLSGEKNGILYERLDTTQACKNLYEVKSVPMSFMKIDIVIAYVMILIGFLYWNLIFIGSFGLGVTIFTVVLCTLTIAYFKTSGIRQSKASLGFLALIALSALNFALFDAILIKALNFLFLTLCFVYWVCIYAGTRMENKISLYAVSDLIYQLFVIPFYNFTGCFKGIIQIFTKGKKGKEVLGGIAGILLFLPVLILVITLLANADAAFESLISKIQFSISDKALEYLWQIILGTPVAFYLYGLLYGNIYKRRPGNATTETVNTYIEVFRFSPALAVYSALTVLNLVYLTFFLVQASYLFSAFSDILPQNMTYAEYARRGFFELCAVSGINLAVITTAHLIVKRDRVKILQGETAVICVFTIALIATAMSKMGMYISYYGLTRPRVYTSWFMILLLFIFIIILIRQFRSFQGTRIAVVGGICLFMALCYSNPDGMIAKYNIERYQAGTLETLDIDSFYDLSDGAVPYIYELYQETEDNEMKGELKQAIMGLFDSNMSNHQSTFRDFNLQKYKADLIRKKI
jgi:hypothetical protein